MPQPVRPFQTKTFKFKIDKKSIDTNSGTFEGYASVFGNVDSWGDVVMKGAFTRTLQAHQEAGKLVKMLFQHDWMSPIGLWPSMEQDNYGLYGKGQINMDLQLGRDCMSNIKMGVIDGLSIGYEAIGPYVDKGVRYLPEVKLWETSPVVFPANELCDITSVKNYLPSATTQIQNIVLSKSGFTEEKAVAWIKANQFRHDKMVEDTKGFQFVQFDSADCEEGCGEVIELSESVKAVVGRRKKSLVLSLLTKQLDEFYEPKQDPAKGHSCSCKKSAEAPVEDHAFTDSLLQIRDEVKNLDERLSKI